MADAPCVEVIEQGENGLGTQIKSRPLAWWQAVVLVAVAGPAVGVLSFIAQNRLTDVWGAIANSGTPWLVAAFVIGALMPSDGWAAAAGLCMLLGTLLGYYLAADKIVHAATMSRIVVFWVGIALIGGPIFGITGRWWRVAPHWRRRVAAALLGAAFVAEGLYFLQLGSLQLRFLGGPTAGWIEIAVGVLTPVIWGRSGKDRLYGLLALLPLVLLGIAAYVVLIRLLILAYRGSF
jgi:hypothetical protein